VNIPAHIVKRLAAATFSPGVSTSSAVSVSASAASLFFFVVSPLALLLKDRKPIVDDDSGDKICFDKLWLCRNNVVNACLLAASDGMRRSMTEDLDFWFREICRRHEVVAWRNILDIGRVG
jgi:hypothetical protein